MLLREPQGFKMKLKWARRRRRIVNLSVNAERIPTEATVVSWAPEAVLKLDYLSNLPPAV